MRQLRGLFCAAIAVGLAACSDQLDVVNNNNPDAERALARPGDVENLISASYTTMWNNSYGSGQWAQLMCLGGENYSNLANFGMGSRCQVPRPPIDNSRNNNAAGDNYGAYLGLHRAARAAAMGLQRVLDPAFTFFPNNVSQENRAIAFANFVIGVSVGNIALMYDSGAAVNEIDDAQPRSTPLPLLNYDALMAYALGKLDSALAYTTAARFGTQTIPSAWVSAGANLTVPQFRALIFGYKARLRAGVARNPTERAAVNWAAVIADADSFLLTYTAANEFTMSRASTSPFGFGTLITFYQSNSINWHQVWGFWANMAAPQAAADAWLATPVAARTNYTIVSADRRFPTGATRAAQQAAPGLYFENKATGNDWFGEPLGNSEYRHRRWLALRNGVQAGATVTFTPMPAAEIRMLAAEGEYRAGNFAAAAARVDVSRIANGQLPGLVANGVTNATTLVPGGAACVPRIPVAPFNVTACGNLWEALKWEYRMETQLTTYSGWWVAGRGWGDNPAGTPTQWPVPYQEMDTRAQAFYAMPGPAAVGTYGI